MRRKLHWLLISRLAIAGTLLIAVGLFEQDNSSRSFVPVLASVSGLVVLASAFYFLAFRSSVSYRLQGFLQLSIDLIITTWLVYNTGDVESPFLALYLVILFASSALFGRREVLILGFSGAALYTTVAILTMEGIIGRASGWPIYVEVNLPWIKLMFALNCMAILAVAALSGHLAERARRNETELATATRDLADYRLFNDRIIESMRSGLVTTDLRGNIITFNRAAEEITGYKVPEVRGRNIFTIFGDIQKQIEVGLESIRTRSRLPRFDIGCKTADGRELHLGFSVAPLVDESDHARGYVLTFQDLTEVMELEREVRRQERLAALGKMAAGLAHEIRNPLASMRGSVQVLASELSFSPDQSQLMEIVLRESDRLNRIVSDFLTYARPPRIERTVIELSSILSETVALLRNSTELTPDHLLTERFPSEPVHYNGDPNQIRQIFWNLSRNAIQAMPRGGELQVTLEAGPGLDVTISFRDTGQGMSREQKDRMFEPFNSSSGGTGLGMAIVYQLVRDHNGKIFVESEAGKGTSIAIKLPAGGRVIRNEESASSPSPAIAASGAEVRNNRLALNSGKRE
ncbi:MAG TPA: ATP-binding protein [Blastocatellia bacterium]|jgi:two-component system sensor histidine kinase PilS (NtrC family)|nr:ATP-binding protein [Blastocatellia bacterium]